MFVSKLYLNFLYVLILLSNFTTLIAKESRFEKMWEYEIPYNNLLNTVQSQPIIFHDLLIFVDHNGHLIALNKFNGYEKYNNFIKKGAGRRGISLDESSGKIYLTARDQIFIIDAKNGKVLKSINSTISVTKPIISNKCIVVFGSTNGEINCHEKGNEENILWSNKLGTTARIWSNPIYVEKYNSVYFTTSNPGGLSIQNRPEDTYSSSLRSINLLNGNINFHQQMVLNDVWDFDGVGSPIYINNFIYKDEYIDLIVALNKTGTIFVLNAQNGKPIKDNQFLFNKNFYDSEIEDHEIYL